MGLSIEKNERNARKDSESDEDEEDDESRLEARSLEKLLKWKKKLLHKFYKNKHSDEKKRTKSHAKILNLSISHLF